LMTTCCAGPKVSGGGAPRPPPPPSLPLLSSSRDSTISYNARCMGVPEKMASPPRTPPPPPPHTHTHIPSEALFNPPPAGGHAPMPPYMLLKRDTQYFLRIQLVRNTTAAPSVVTGAIAAAAASAAAAAAQLPSLSFQLLWSVNGGPSAPVPTSALAPTVPPAQAARLTMQQQLASGWGTWYVGVALSL
jgi:hypothetical protein